MFFLSYMDVYLNPTNLPPCWSCCNLPAVVFSTAIKATLHQGFFDARVWTFWERPCVKAPLAGYTAFLTEGFHRAISCSVTVNEDGFPQLY